MKRVRIRRGRRLTAAAAAAAIPTSTGQRVLVAIAEGFFRALFASQPSDGMPPPMLGARMCEVKGCKNAGYCGGTICLEHAMKGPTK